MRGRAIGAFLVLFPFLIGCPDAGDSGGDLNRDTWSMYDYGRFLDMYGLDKAPSDEAQGQDQSTADDAQPPPDTGANDPGSDDTGLLDVDATPDEGAASDKGAASDPGTPVFVFCHRTDACLPGEVCNLSTGRCERRGATLGGALQVWGFEPRVAAPGDTLVVDGQAFYTGLFNFTVKIRVSGKALDTRADENRAVARLGAFSLGAVNVGNSTSSASALVPIAQGPSGIVSCGPDDPPPYPGPALDPADPGPYAAGFVDFTAHGKGRAFYPATCGGVRRPTAEGTFPVVVICHGDGALSLNYEYLAWHLASWGFVSLMPETDTPSEIAALANNPASAFDGPVPAPALDLVPGVVLVGHSRGTYRIEEAWSQVDHGAGIVYLGPVNKNQVPAVPLLYFGATGDLQSRPSTYGPKVYGNHPGPKVQVVIQGGNHSGFSDHKNWLGAMSDNPLEIERSRQHVLVQQFALPFVQRTLGGPQPFADYLESPPPDPDFTFQSEE